MASDVKTTETTPSESDFRALLLNERQDLQAQLVELGVGGEGGLTYDANFADTSQVTAERGEAEVLSNELRDTLKEVEAALARLDNHTYGICEACGHKIAPARLEAMPAARYCIKDAGRQSSN